MDNKTKNSLKKKHISVKNLEKEKNEEKQKNLPKHKNKQKEVIPQTQDSEITEKKKENIDHKLSPNKIRLSKKTIIKRKKQKENSFNNSNPNIINISNNNIKSNFATADFSKNNKKTKTIISDTDTMKTETTRDTLQDIYKNRFLYKKQHTKQSFSISSKTNRSLTYKKNDIFQANISLFKDSENNNEESNHKLNYINNYLNNKNNNNFINIEDLLLIEEKFNDVKESIISMHNTANECFDLINSYENSSLYNNLENYFKESYSKSIVRYSIMLCLYNLIVTYHTSFDEKFFNSCYEYLNSMIDMNHKIYLQLCNIISMKISRSVKNNIWVEKLRNLLSENLKPLGLNDKEYVEFLLKHNINNSNGIIESLLEIKFYSNKIRNYINLFLKKMNMSDIKNQFSLIFEKLKEISSDELIKFFKEKIYKVVNKNASVAGKDASSYINEKTKNFNPENKIKIPYLTNKNPKKFTVVLDLDETLISFKLDKGKNNKGVIRFRPGLDIFLQKIKEKYEIIVFTSGTKDYADPLIDAIEQEHKYFDVRLYREHTIVYENDVIKDISRIGRSLDKIIIVENMKQNYRLQKENGILIKSFYGEDLKDTCLIALADILIKISDEFDDVRKGIAFYKNEILNKVSSNMGKKKKNVNK